MREKSYVGDGIDRKSQQRKENYFKMDIWHSENLSLQTFFKISARCGGAHL